jgi:hypothetical protein
MPEVINGEPMQSINIPGIILPRSAGEPNLPGLSRFIAVPQGATAEVKILDYRTEVLHAINLAPSFVIPSTDDDTPLKYKKDHRIYGQDAIFPASPVLLSEPKKLRGVDAVMLSITPFGYNPVTQDLTVYRDLRLRVNFSGGRGHFGEDRLRSRWWEPLLQQNLLNYASLPKVNFNRERTTDEDNVEYIIIIPDDPEFSAWADTLKRWRNEQGIITGVTALSVIGGNNYELISAYIDNAYLNWEIPPVAVLLLADFSNYGEPYGITNTNGADNRYADVDGDYLPDMAIGRITAQDYTQLESMIGKMLSYEREPYTDVGFYQNPMIAGAWEDDRWFILTCEIIYGYFYRQLGKTPVREYALITSTPPTTFWSTALNTHMVADYFGPGGLGYIPETPGYLTDWGSGPARINQGLNSGAFFAQHCDHGSGAGWVHPSYLVPDLDDLENEMYPFVFGDNCSSGNFTLAYYDCFTEVIHRMRHGALGSNAPSYTTYSFVADVFVYGFYDNLWPDFDPYYGIPQLEGSDLLPGFANTGGKYYLEASNWPSNPNYKHQTYEKFTHHGCTFMTLYSELPQVLSVEHDSIATPGATTFSVSADAGSLIGLSVDGEVIGTTEGTGGPEPVAITVLLAGDTLRVTVTKANYYRYIADVPVEAPTLTIALTPSGPPIQIPASGGSFDFVIEIANTGQSQVSADAWTNVLLPGGGLKGPLLGPVSLVIPPGYSLERLRTQTVPAGAPAGTYTYQAWVGVHPTEPWASDFFTFEKLGVGDADDLVAGWQNTGESFPEYNGGIVRGPDELALLSVRPNPFNPTTTISFSLPDASLVMLNVYGITGRLVTTLIDGYRDAGTHEITFNGSNLASGIYVYRLEAGEASVSGKMVLVK